MYDSIDGHNFVLNCLINGCLCPVLSTPSLLTHMSHFSVKKQDPNKWQQLSDSLYHYVWRVLVNGEENKNSLPSLCGDHHATTFMRISPLCIPVTF